MMRVLVVASNIRVPDAHGGSTHVSELVAHLRLDHDVMLIARHGSEGQQTLPIGLNAPPFLKHTGALVSLPFAVKRVHSFDPDVIYERASSYGLGAILARWLKRPLLCMVLDNHASPLSLATATRIISTKPEIVHPAFRHKVTRVQWGANTELFNPLVDGSDVRRSLGIGDEVLIVYTGSFKRWHGLEDLVESAGSLDDDFRFLLVGDGPMRRKIEDLIAKKNLTDRFHLIGRVPYGEVPRYCAAADVCVAPLRPELHDLGPRFGGVLDPLKVFEYLSMRKPVISSRLENIEQLFTDSVHLLFVTPGKPIELADAFERIRLNPELATRIAASGYERVIDRFTWDRHAKHLGEIMTEMVEQGCR